MVTPLAFVDETKTIDGLTFEQYMNEPDRVRREAIAAGLQGQPYKHYFTTKGRLNGKTEIRYTPLNNLDLYEFAKAKYAK